MNKYNVTGIVVEYNPFHYGHLYHIKQARQITNCDILIAVMSSHFVQRGEPVIIDKWTRAQIALENGVDIVLELPFHFTNQSATQFAFGSIEILKQLEINHLVFGSESNNLDELKEIASLNVNPNYFKELMNQGHSYPKSYGLMAKSYGSNDILGISYLKQIQGSTITPHSIQRIDNNYNDTSLSSGLASATAIRSALKNQLTVSKYTPMSNNFINHQIISIDDYFPYIRHLLLTIDKQSMSELHLFSEGIENHLIKNAYHSYTFEEFINNTTTRRYTASRIKRTLMSLFVNAKKIDVDGLVKNKEVRVLGFNKKGQKYLKHLDNPLIKTNFRQLSSEYKKLEYQATHSFLIPYNIEYQKKITKRELLSPIIIY